MRLSDHLSPRTVEGVRRDILTQIEAESERSGVAMNSEWASDKAAAEGGEQGRAITREEEARVRALLRDALDVYPSGINLYWSHDDKRMTSVSIDADGQSYRDLTRDEVAKAARAGIVPGADGWCWAPVAAVAPPHDFDPLCEACKGETTHDGPLTQAPPSWLTAAVLAALPPSGEERDFEALYSAMGPLPDFVSIAMLRGALATLTEGGKIEPVPVGRDGLATWRRWGVPEGWAGWVQWSPHKEDMYLVRVRSNLAARVACADQNGEWVVFESEESSRIVDSGTATPPTLAGGRTAALRACYERGVFGPRPAPTVVAETPQGAPSRQAYDPTRIRERLVVLLSKGSRKATDILLDVLACGAPKGFALPDLRGQMLAVGASMVDMHGERWAIVPPASDPIADVTPAAPPPAPTRAEQVRLALLAVLARGAVTGLSYVLEALSATGMRPAPDGAEARQAAAEVGALVDGARWSLPAMPPGWGWHGTGPSYLCRVDAVEPAREAVALVEEEHCLWDWKLCPEGEWNIIDSLADGQRQALAAARRAGLFARPVAVDALPPGIDPPAPLRVTITAPTVEGGPTVMHVHAPPGLGLSPEDNAPRAPLPSGQALASHIERMVGIREGQSDCSLARLIEAFAVGVEERAFQRMHDIAKLTAEELREERANAIPHAAVEASLAQRAYAADAPLLYAVWKASTTARDAYRAEGMSSRFSRSLVALWDLLDAAEREPADLGNTDAAERVADLQRAHDNAVASARKTGAQANALEADLRAMRERAERAERDRDAYLSKALAVEAREAEEHNRRCEAERDLAALQAGLDGLRTWATGARAVGR